MGPAQQAVPGRGSAAQRCRVRQMSELYPADQGLTRETPSGREGFNAGAGVRPFPPAFRCIAGIPL